MEQRRPEKHVEKPELLNLTLKSVDVASAFNALHDDDDDDDVCLFLQIGIQQIYSVWCSTHGSRALRRSASMVSYILSYLEGRMLSNTEIFHDGPQRRKIRTH